MLRWPPDGQVFLLRNLVTSPNLQTLWSSNDRTSDPVAVQFSEEGTRLYLVTRQGTTAILAFIDKGRHLWIADAILPVGFILMIRLNEISDGPLKLLDITSPEPRIWFVPALLSDEAHQEADNELPRALRAALLALIFAMGTMTAQTAPSNSSAPLCFGG